jgi:TonB family protein
MRPFVFLVALAALAGCVHSNAAKAPAVPEDEPPVVLEQSVPVYPPAAREAEKEAVVAMRLLIDVGGKVTKAQVIKSVGDGFDESALSAIRQFRFRPALRDGQPIASVITYKIRFEARSQSQGTYWSREPGRR